MSLAKRKEMGLTSGGSNGSLTDARHTSQGNFCVSLFVLDLIQKKWIGSVSFYEKNAKSKNVPFH